MSGKTYFQYRTVEEVKVGRKNWQTVRHTLEEGWVSEDDYNCTCAFSSAFRFCEMHKGKTCKHEKKVRQIIKEEEERKNGEGNVP